MKRFTFLLALFFTFSLSQASSFVANPDSTCADESLKSGGKASKKFVLHVKVSSPTCVGARQVSNLKKDKDLMPFYEFEILTAEPDSTDQNGCTSYISYQGVYLGVIHGVPTKSFLVTLQPVFNNMIRDPKIMSQRKDTMASIVRAKK